MGFQIRVTPDALRAAAEQVRTIAAATTGAVDSGSSIAVALSDAWEGKGGEAMISQLEELRVSATKVADGATESASVLEQVATAFENADRGEGAPILNLISVVPNHRAFTLVGPGVVGPGAFRPWQIVGGGMVRIVPERVRELAVQCRNLAGTYEDAAGSLRSVVNGLANDWEGNAYNRFADSCNELLASYSGVQAALIAIADSMSEAADRYEDLDNSL